MRMSLYIPGMMYAHGVTMHGQSRIILGPLIAANNNAYMPPTSVNVAGVATVANGLITNANITDANFGRAIQYNMSASVTGTIITDGWDYLNQPMSEGLTFSAQTSIQGNKCFKTLRQITWTAMPGATLAAGASQGGRIGMPFRIIKILNEENGGVPNVNIGNAQFTPLTPQTLVGPDPRGWYSINSGGSCNGVNIQTITAECCNDVDPITGQGGLHGMPHFSN
jgi:hypothetical protein